MKTTKIFLLSFSFLFVNKINGQVESNFVKINNPIGIYANISAGLPISVLNTSAKNIIKNELNMNYSLSNSNSISCGAVISNLKNKFGGRFNFNFVNQSYKNDSLSLNLNLTSLVIGVNYRFYFEKVLFDLGLNLGTIQSNQKLFLNFVESNDIYQSLTNLSGNLISIDSKPILNLVLEPCIYYKVHPNYSLFLNYEYNFTQYSKLGKIKNQTIFANVSTIRIGTEILLNSRAIKKKP